MRSNRFIAEIQKTEHVAKSYGITEGIHESFYADLIEVYKAFQIASLLDTCKLTIVLDNKGVCDTTKHMTLWKDKINPTLKLEGNLIWKSIAKLSDSLEFQPEVV